MRLEKPPLPNELSVKMVIQSYYPSIGGAEKQCLELSKGLKKRGFQVEVLTERWNDLPAREEIEGIPVRRMGWGGAKVWHSMAFMLATFFYLFSRARTYSVIHVHLAASHSVAAALIGKIFKKKVVVLIGGGNKLGEIALSQKTFHGKLKLIALGILRPQFIILNQEQKQELQGYGLEKIPVTLIPNGVDLGRYRAITQEEKMVLREKLGWSGLIFLYTGRFSSDKIPIAIFENFLTGWANALKKRKDVQFILVGQGPLEKEYNELILRHHLQDSIHLWPARTNVSELYQAADVFVLPSITEGLSNSLLEAMASNLPVLASRVPGIVDFIREDTHGFLFDPFSPKEIESCLSEIFMRPAKFLGMGKQSWLTAVTYSMSKTVEQYMALYNSEKSH